mgnify:CR=1 FL=1
MDIPRKNIKREIYDAFYDYYDVSRAVSPPTSMLAEVEINLFYDGYRTSFDDSIEKSQFEEDAMYHNLYSRRDEEGYLVPVDKEDERKAEDYYHTYSITEHLEKLAFQYSLAYKFPLSHLTGIGSLTNLKQCLKWYQTSLDTPSLNTIKTLLHNNKIRTLK